MKLKQLSIFLENRPGHLSHICETLADAKINIVTLTLSDTSEFGILRLIVREWELAKDILEVAGCAVNITNVMAIEVPNHSGGLEHILKISDAAELSVEYMYGFAFSALGNAKIIIRFNDLDRAANALEVEGISILSALNFYSNP